MEERKTSDRYWRVGELAEATGLTVRTLHHYENIGPPENLAGWDPELMRHLDQALATLHETEDEPC